MSQRMCTSTGVRVQLIKMLIDKCKQQEAVIGELERQQEELGLVRDQQSSELSVLESTKLDLKRRTCAPLSLSLSHTHSLSHIQLK